MEGYRTRDGALVCRRTCANLNYYGVCVHRDGEVPFGDQEESKLVVSVSAGFSALFRWKPPPGPDCEADSCCLHHGDLLVMDGRCQDWYLHSKLHGEFVNIIFRWLKNHLPQCPLGAGVVCCLPTCVRGSFVPVSAGPWWPVWELGDIPLFLLRW